MEMKMKLFYSDKRFFTSAGLKFADRIRKRLEPLIVEALKNGNNSRDIEAVFTHQVGYMTVMYRLKHPKLNK